MELDKIRNLSDQELAVETNKAAEQLFRLRFNLRLGQTEGVKKLRGLKKDIARIKTITRERELHLHGEEHREESAATETHKASAKKAPKRAGRKTAAKKTAAKKATGNRSGAKKAAKKATRKSGTKKGAR
jgi:large subunit ribosomal protein L29